MLYKNKIGNIKYMFYNDYLKSRKIDNKNVLIGKTKNSYLIGPKINNEFDEESFFKRIISSSIYDKKTYRKIWFKSVSKLLYKYYDQLDNNEVIEIIGKDIIKHTIIKLPRSKNEKE